MAVFLKAGTRREAGWQGGQDGRRLKYCALVARDGGVDWRGES
jgi:hypothetical protein